MSIEGCINTVAFLRLMADLGWLVSISRFQGQYEVSAEHEGKNYEYETAPCVREDTLSAAVDKLHAEVMRSEFTKA